MAKSRGHHETILNPSCDNISRNNKNHRVNGSYSSDQNRPFFHGGVSTLKIDRKRKFDFGKLKKKVLFLKYS